MTPAARRSAHAPSAWQTDIVHRHSTTALPRPEQTFSMQLAPAEHLVRIDPVLSRNSRHRSAGSQRLLDDALFQFEAMPLVNSLARARSDWSFHCVHDPNRGHISLRPTHHNHAHPPPSRIGGTGATLTSLQSITLKRLGWSTAASRCRRRRCRQCPAHQTTVTPCIMPRSS